MAVKFTQKERLCGGLQLMGYTRVQTASRKYVVYDNGEPERRMFIGKMGALRVGRVATDSIPCTESYKRMVMQKFDDQTIK